MSVLMVSYDLGIPETSSEYTNLIAYIKTLGTSWAKPLKSQFFLETTRTPKDVCDLVAAKVDENDTVLVCDIKGAMAWNTLPPDVAKWIHDRLG